MFKRVVTLEVDYRRVDHLDAQSATQRTLGGDELVHQRLHFERSGRLVAGPSALREANELLEHVVCVRGVHALGSAQQVYKRLFGGRDGRMRRAGARRAKLRPVGRHVEC